MASTSDHAKGSPSSISFYKEEMPGGAPNVTIPLLIRARMANFDVRRILVDQGSSVDIMYSQLFKTLQLNNSHLTPNVGSDLQGFNGTITKPWGFVELIVSIGSVETTRAVKVQFLVINCPSIYQCILGRPTLAELIAVPSTVHLKLKYYTTKGQVATLHGDIEAARRCFEASAKGLSAIKTPGQEKTATNATSETNKSMPRIDTVDLDSCFPGEPEQSINSGASEGIFRPIPNGDFELVALGEDPTRGVKIGSDLPDLAKRQLKACLRENADLFAWSAAEMPGLDPEVACHHLTIDPTCKAVAQRRRKQSLEKTVAAELAVKDLIEARFISEAKACPKDAYPLPNIDKLVNNSAGFKLLSFMDAYSGYNQIPMAKTDKKYTAFMTESGNYYYNVMPFGLKNGGATYQRMMNKVFQAEIVDMLEVYMDDMIVKSQRETDHAAHLKKVFEQARKCKMRLNPEKCIFGVRAGKFLGFYLTERGIEANQDKCRAFSDLPTPNSKKSIQTLNGMLTSLSRFVAKSAQHALPLFKLLRKETTFKRTEECERALSHLKRELSSPPVLSRPEAGEILYLYLAVAPEAISAALIRETSEGQKPIYFTSKALQGPEIRYQQIKKVVLVLITAARRLKRYFLAHTIVVRTKQPVKQLRARPDMSGRMLWWSLELAEFDIKYEGRKALKAQVLADFIAEMAFPETTNNNARRWTLYVDSASSSTGSGAGIILESGEGTLIEVSLSLSFPTSNNQAEYEALLVGLRLANDLEAEEIEVFTDSQLVASHILGEYQVKSEALAEYLALVKEILARFRSAKVKHIPREHNARADVLSKLASTRKKGGNKSVIQEILPKPSTEIPSSLSLVNAIGDTSCWMTPVYNYLTSDLLPTDLKEASTIRRRACSYVLVENRLYQRGFSIPLLRCIDEGTVPHILQEIHEGINSQHIGGRSLARKALRAGYYWPTMQDDAKEYVKRCDKCQHFGDMHLAPPQRTQILIISLAICMVGNGSPRSVRNRK
ncbi:uncharacterized protein LOC131594725 [Vicia villosa]|uniref:uncharacterized protein LOC131594725 n=1 Tax=Vicia villosa TaxID=3911 RepID=UPI00273BE30E|nr:uncharacterized protein LOC131594725 [Vicia villosa]